MLRPRLGASRLTGSQIMPVDNPDPAARDRLTATWIELAIRLAVLGLLVYATFILIRPFITIAIWSIVLTVALYPGYDSMVRWLGGRRRLAAFLLTLVGLMILLGPATWLVLSLVDSLSSLSERLDLAHFTVPSPPASVKEWPLIGEPVYQFWTLASTNLQAALVKIAPQLRPVGSGLLLVAAEAGTGALQFLIALIVAGFLYSPAPALVDAMKRFSHRLASQQGETFVQIVGATIRAVARGVIGVAALQTFLHRDRVGGGRNSRRQPAHPRLPGARNHPDRPRSRDLPADHLGLDRDGHDPRPCCSPPT